MKINEEVVYQLEQLDLPVSVVSCIGKMQTYKSTLLNNLFRAGHPSCQFEQHSDASKSTEGGTTMYSRLVLDHNQTGRNVLLLDFWGFGGAVRGTLSHIHSPLFHKGLNPEVDARLFALAVLLSDLVVYNGQQKIDANELADMR